MSRLASYLTVSRHGIYYIRDFIDGREHRVSLRTRNPIAAKIASYQYGAARMAGKINILDLKVKISSDGIEIESNGSPEDHQQTLEVMDKYLAHSVDLPLSPPRRDRTYPIHSLSIQTACDLYLESRKNEVSHDTIQSQRTHLNRLVNDVAPTPGHHLCTLSRDALKDSLKRLEKDGRAPKTIDMYADTWYLAWKWWIAQKHAVDNPVEKIGWSRKERSKLVRERSVTRMPFTGDELRKLFDPVQLDALEWPEDIFLPLIALFTGARLESLARLETSNFREYEPSHWCVFFNPDYDKMGRAREIPLPPTLVDAGLIDYISDIRSAFGDGPIFPHLKEVGERRKKGQKPGGRFSDRKKALGFQKDKVFHSFRSTLISTLAMNRCDGFARRKFAGHDEKEDGKLDVHDKNYANKGIFAPGELAKAIFPHLDYSVIGYQWQGWRYKPGSALKMIKAIMARQAMWKMKDDRMNEKSS